jgi:subtilase family serine protease
MYPTEQGISIFYASGDNGVGCQHCQKQEPDWPASSAYVTTGTT